MTAKRKITEMEQLTAGYEAFIQSKQVKKDGKLVFTKAIKKAAKLKARGSK